MSWSLDDELAWGLLGVGGNVVSTRSSSSVNRGGSAIGASTGLSI